MAALRRSANAGFISGLEEMRPYRLPQTGSARIPGVLETGPSMCIEAAAGHGPRTTGIAPFPFRQVFWLSDQPDPRAFPPPRGGSGILRGPSPTTAAGPQRLLTVFPLSRLLPDRKGLCHLHSSAWLAAGKRNAKSKLCLGYAAPSRGHATGAHFSGHGLQPCESVAEPKRSRILDVPGTLDRL